MKESTVPVETAPKQMDSTREESRTLLPAVDIFEIQDGLAVVADLPGVEKDAIDVRVENDVLTIKGTPKPHAKGDVAYREYEPLPFFRQFQLGEHVDQAKIKADMKYGVLTIRLPKAEAAKPKKIAVNLK